MHRVSAIVAASTVVFIHIASAADLPHKASVYAPPPPLLFSWTGFYIGGNAGYGWGRASTTYVAPGLPDGFIPPDQVAVSANGSARLDPTGFVGGAQIGYNWQFAPTWVLGIEADFQAFNLRGSFDGTFPIAEGNHITHTEVSADWLFTLRGRFGYAVDRLLIYGTGGLAVGKVNFKQINTFTGFSTTDSFSATDTKTGWAIGGGVEYAFQNNWSIKAEYLYVELDNISGISTTAGGAITGSFGHDTDFKVNIVRAGINYRF
jgi:outer membrane immunogenic protein